MGNIKFNPLAGSQALSDDAAQNSILDEVSIAAESGDSTAIAEAQSVADAASLAASQAIIDAAAASTAASQAIVDAASASTAAVTAQGVADSALSDATIADSAADEAKLILDSAVGSEPVHTGEYLVTDIKKDSTGSMVVEYNDVAYIDTYLKLLARFDGTNGQTSYTAEYTGQVFTFSGTAKLVTSDKKFGVSALSLNLPHASPGIVTVPHNAAYNFAKNNFTIHYWMKFISGGASRGYYQAQISAQYSQPSQLGWVVFQVDGGNGQLALTIDSDASRLVTSGNRAITDDTWHHIAIIRKGIGATDLNIYIDGIGGNAPASGDVDINSAGTGLTLGDWSPIESFRENSILIDEVIIESEAVWTANFTPPTETY